MSADEMLAIRCDLGLTRTEAEVLAILLSEDRIWPAWELGMKLSHSQGQARTLSVFITHLRDKLGRESDSILSNRGRRRGGYQLSPSARSRLLSWNEKRAAA